MDTSQRIVNVCLVVPVYNEQERLLPCIPKLRSFLSGQAGFRCEIVVANNGSSDCTQAVAERFSREYHDVRVLWLPDKGRGGALKRAWLESGADVLSYMDVDLSTDLAAFPALVEAIASGRFDLAIGSRFLPGAQVRRCWKREVTSRVYLGLLRLLCGTALSDAQCGFKAISRQAARVLLPLVEDTGWFFDTELLVLAERRGCRICEVPVRWVENADTRVKLVPTALADLRGLRRLRRKAARTSRMRGAPRRGGSWR